jgi:hypothetical protein
MAMREPALEVFLEQVLEEMQKVVKMVERVLALEVFLRLAMAETQKVLDKVEEEELRSPPRCINSEGARWRHIILLKPLCNVRSDHIL